MNGPTNKRSASWRRLMAAGAAWAPAALLLITRFGWWDRLPETVPTHWSGLGRPDGFSSTTAIWWWLLAIATLAGLTATAATIMHRRAATAVRGLLAVAGAIAGMSTSVWLMSATAALAADTPQTAGLGWRITWLAPGMAWAAIVPAIAGKTPIAMPPATGPGQGLTLTGTQRAAWMVTLRSPLFVAVTALATAVVIIVAVTVEPWVWPVVAVPAAALVLFGQVQVLIDRRGVRLIAALLGLPLKHIPLSQIASASAQDIDPIRWGGWGYRVLPGRSALVLRAGPGLVVQLRDGRRFAVTVDDPQTPAALLTTLASQHQPN